MGRPSEYTPEVALEICALIIEGKSLRAICSAENMPGVRTVYSWLQANESFQQQYARAKEDQADTLADEILDIADDGGHDKIVTEDGTLIDHDHITRSRLRVDTRKWIASKLKPKKYGERLDLNADLAHSGCVEVHIHPVKANDKD